MELIPFREVDVYDEEGKFTPGQIEAAELFNHLDWEGGIDGLWGHGGTGDFPDELKELAAAYGKALNALDAAITAWAAERGVEY